MNKAKDKCQHIKVFVRVRPLNSSEKNSRSPTVVDCASTREIIVNERPVDKISKKFTFDRAFGPSSIQIDVYKTVVKPLIKEVLDGYNCTVFAYGQTGTGKTYTMEGERSTDQTVSWHNDPESGIIPRALSHLFDELRILQAEYTVRVSFLELYNEELFDLLSPGEDSGKIRLFEDVLKKGAVIVHGLEEVTVNNKNEVYGIMERGSRKRQTAATLMNSRSSRSHTVFSITVHIKESNVEGEELLKTGKLNLVDLAGSENIGRSGAVDKRAREAGNINQSLLTLGRVITSLVERAPHIPYRESKLTRLLQESLGGRTKTSIIATVSPAQCNIEETLSTLEYAHRAKNIQNKPEVNQKLEKRALIREYTEEIDRLKRDLVAAREKNGVYIAEENFKDMISKIESQKQELTELLENKKSLTEICDKKEEMNRELNQKLEECREELWNRIEDLKRVHEELGAVREDRDEQVHLLSHHVRTEEQLSAQAHDLLSVADVSTSDTLKLHETLERKRNVEDANITARKCMEESMKEQLTNINEKVTQLRNNETESAEELKKLLSTCLEVAEEETEDSCKFVSLILRTLRETVDLLKQSSIEAVSAQLRSMEKLQQDFQHSCQMKKQDHAASLQRFGVAVTQVLTTIESLRSETVRLKEELITKAESKEGQMQIVSSKIIKELQDVCTTQKDIKEQQETKMHLLNSSVKKLKEEQCTDMRNFQKRFTEMTSEFHKILGDMRTSMERNINDLEVPIQDVTSEFEKRAEFFVPVLKSHIEEVSTMASDAVQEKQEMYSLMEKYTEITSTLLAEESESCTEINQYTQSIISEEDNRAQKELEAVEKHRHNSSESISCYLRNQQETCKELEQRLENSAVSVISRLGQHLQSRRLAGQSWENFCNIRFSEIDKWLQSQSTDVESCHNLLTHFLIKEFQLDIPSGSTPERRDFIYPRELVATSPHERILCRFRAARKVIPETESEDLEDRRKSTATSSGYGDNDSSNSNLSSSSKLSVEFIRKSASTNDISNEAAVKDNPAISEPDIPSMVNKENSMFFPRVEKTKNNVSSGNSKRILSEHN